MSNLHVIFGTGPLGMSVMRELVKRNQPVRMVNRSGKAEVPQRVEVVAADAYQLPGAIHAADGANIIYQCAQPGYTEWVQKFPALQNTILEAAVHHQAKFIVGDNLYMYGAVDGELHENLPNHAHTRKGRVRAEMAETVLAAHQAGKVRVALARGADFYGTGVLGSTLGEMVFSNLLKGKAAQAIGNIDLPHTYTYIDDFGKALVILGEHESALGQIWHVPNAPTRTTRQVLEIAFHLAGLPPRISPMGKMMMRIGGLFIPEARETVEMMYEFEKPFVVNHSKFEQAFGNHATSFEAGLKTTLEWYRQEMANSKDKKSA